MYIIVLKKSHLFQMLIQETLRVIFASTKVLLKQASLFTGFRHFLNHTSLVPIKFDVFEVELSALPQLSMIPSSIEPINLSVYIVF